VAVLEGTTNGKVSLKDSETVSEWHQAADGENFAYKCRRNCCCISEWSSAVAKTQIGRSTNARLNVAQINQCQKLNERNYMNQDLLAVVTST